MGVFKRLSESQRYEQYKDHISYAQHTVDLLNLNRKSTAESVYYTSSTVSLNNSEAAPTWTGSEVSGDEIPTNDYLGRVIDRNLTFTSNIDSLSLNTNRSITRIFWHTAAHGANGQSYDTTPEQIDKWHRARKFNGIGYHFVVRMDGTIQTGRSMGLNGAHVQGWNTGSIGICFSGHGDLTDFTPAQKDAGTQLTANLLKRFDIANKFLSDWSVCMGHREVRQFAGTGKATTSKSCPGHKVSCNELRALVKGLLTSP